MTTKPQFMLASPMVFTEPFHYFTATRAFSNALSRTILTWLEGDIPWRLVKTDFYEQFEISLADVTVPPQLTFLKERSFPKILHRRIESIFDERLSERIDCTIHKLTQGQRIRIHNDFIPGQETHRVLVQLNRGWDVEQGGFLMLFNSSDPGDLHRVLAPDHNSIVGFAISERSNHAVSTIHGGQRFTLVFSFYGQGAR